MSNLLIIPVQLNALAIADDVIGIGPVADFSQLPYTVGGADFNTDHIGISEEIAAEPFHNQNFQLRPGIHLHWLMTGFLTKERAADRLQTLGNEVSKFPLVPNRWVVLKYRANAQGVFSFVKKCVIESDYLFPPDTPVPPAAVNIPDPIGATDTPPFRFMGRDIAWEQWPLTTPGSDYFRQLTAMGYGTPLFSTLYANCHSVFGWYDEEVDFTTDTAVRYDVFGIYGSAGDDYVKRYVTKLQAGLAAGEEAALLYKRLQKNLNINYGAVAELPDQSVCYGSVTFVPKTIECARLWQQEVAEPVTVVVGNTGTEALSACLGYLLAPSAPHLVEDQLEAIQFASKLDGLQMDLGAVFEESRHEKEFKTLEGGAVWNIRPDTDTSDQNNAQDSPVAAIPLEMAHQLNTLNELQEAYDDALFQLESMKKQLFADWYKYMISAYFPDDSNNQYPDSDEVRYFLEHKNFSTFSKLQSATGSCAWNMDAVSGKLLAIDPGNSRPGSLAVSISVTARDLVNAINTYNTANAGQGQKKQPVCLQRSPANRFWEPTEPVILVKGDICAATHLPDPEDALNCFLLKNVASTYPNALSKDVLGKFIDALYAAGGTLLPHPSQNKIPWNPFLLEWEVELFPLRHGSNETESDVAPIGKYSPEYITDNFQLQEDDCDLALRPGRGEVVKGANVYIGQSLLTPGAATVQTRSLHGFLKKQIGDGKLLPVNFPDEYYQLTKGDIAGIRQDYETKNSKRLTTDAAKAADALYSAILAYQLLLRDDFNILTQALSGFNAALLMGKQTFQLLIKDPLGFENNEVFTQQVGAEVGNFNRFAPAPMFGFNPIRAGELNISRLRILDTFGRVRLLGPERQLAANKLYNASSRYPILLPPRLTQPARMDCWWLSADPLHDDMEMNDHPATSPICGWILPDHLDNSLAFYGADGRALGSLLALSDVQNTALARWAATPGGQGAATVADIENPHLKKVAQHIQRLGPDFADRFLSTLDYALDKMEPASATQNTGIALLMGRPLALVRVALQIELKGLPAIEQDWQTFLRDMARDERETNDFELVKLPVRVGEYRKLNDGLAGYWIETKGAIAPETVFYAPQTDPVALDQSHEQIVCHSEASAHLSVRIDDDPVVLCMLMDPRGAVHITTGVLPTRTLSVPPDQYAPALSSIGITFLSTPILTPQHQVQISLPTEAGYQWRWIGKEQDAWTAVSTVGILTKSRMQAAFPNGDALWQALLAAGWIVPDGDDRATVKAKDQRLTPTLSAPFQDQTTAIELLLDQTRMGPMRSDATHNGPNIIREGWLKLEATT